MAQRSEAEAPEPVEQVERSRGVVLARDHDLNKEGYGSFVAPGEIELAAKATFPQVRLPIGIIAAMGNPERITVRIHAGDQLAEPEPE